MKPEKPLGMKSYGSIPHLPGSRLGAGDHHVTEGQAEIATLGCRKGDFVCVSEKLDGSNVAVAKLGVICVPLIRSGYPAIASKYLQHRIFAEWVYKNYERFFAILYDGERVIGEWLLQAHGTRYTLQHEPFVVIDIMRDHERLPISEIQKRIKHFGFVTPHIFCVGDALDIDEAMKILDETNGFHGAIDPVEGAVWRVETNGKFNFMTKYVRHDKEDGKYLPELPKENPRGGNPIWNIEPEILLRQ
jgi:hypothetical protein